MKTYTIAVLGCGNRGCAYAEEVAKRKKNFVFTALCDPQPSQMKRLQRIISKSDQMLYTDENEFFQEKRADALIIATPDREHVSQAVRAMRLGYDVLLEKPISDSREDIEELLKVHKETGRHLIVCHVLRYGPGYQKCAEILKSGVLGKLYAIDASERVAYWHWAQAYVRGIGASMELGHPAILAKCSHDLDLIQYYAGSKCDTVSSVGELRFFRPENAPAGAADRCLDCIHQEKCPYSAKRIYIDGWYEQGKPEFVWPFTKVSNEYPHTEEVLREALKTNENGRCAFKCQVEKVDHQMVQMTFRNGVKASLKMVYASAPGRRIVFYCNYGELVFDEREEKIEVRPFGEQPEIISLKTVLEGGNAHGGGDRVLSETFCNMIEGVAECPTTLEESVECHLMGIAAEESRKRGGTLVKVHENN